MKLINRQYDDVYGVGSKGALTAYTVFALLCVAVPVIFFLVTLLKRVLF